MKFEMKDAFGPLLALAAFVAGLIQYRATTYDEYIKPVRETELRLYEEASADAARIATLPKDSPDREQSRRDFLRLSSGPLIIVEDFDHGPAEDQQRIKVEEAMDVFRLCLETEECKDDLNAVRKLSVALAWTCRESMRESWRYKAVEAHLDQQAVIREFRKKLQKAER